MTSHVQPYCSRATVAQLEPSFLSQKASRQEQAVRLSLLLIASFLLLSSPLSCEVRSLHAQPNHISEQTKAKLAAYQAMLQLIDSYYVEERHVGGLIDSLMSAVMSKLDPHSYYNDPEDYASNKAYYSGEEERFGFRYECYNGQAVVQTVAEGSSAADAGLLPGDRIESVWGQPVSTLSEDELYEVALGGKRIEMVISRNAGRKRMPIKMDRRVIYDKSVEVAEMLDQITGYIYLSGFIATSYFEVKRVLEDFTALGMKKLIFDLRGNRGGLLREANYVAGLFLPYHTPLTGVKYRNDAVIRYDTSYMPGRYTDLELIVLIDQNSASAAEAVAGILQEYDRAVLIGQPTYGKGVSQQQFSLPDGGSFMMTTAKYYMPSGRCIQRIYDGANYVQAHPALEAGLNMDHEKDKQVSFDGIYKTKGGRTVYGGQGVIPEIIVELDTVPAVLPELNKLDVFERFADTMLNLNAEILLSKYRDARSFVQGYQPKKEMLALFTKQAGVLGLKDAPRRLQPVTDQLLHLIKRWFTHRLYPQTGWIVSGRSTDAQYKEAVRLVKQQLVLK